MTSLTKKLITALFAVISAICLAAGILFNVGLLVYAAEDEVKPVTLTADDLNVEGTVLKGLSPVGLNKIKDVVSFAFTLPANVTKIAEAPAESATKGLFGNDSTKLTAITVPENSNLASIGSGAFYGSGLKVLDLSNAKALTTIGGDAFRNCTALTEVTISTDITTFGASVFRGCTALESVTLSNDLKTIGASAFYGCTNLTSIVLPENLTSIGTSAFAVSALTSITIPEKVSDIGTNAFRDCKRLATVNFNATNVVSYPAAVYNPFGGAGMGTGETGITLNIGKAGGAAVTVIPANMFNAGTNDAAKHMLKTVNFINVNAESIGESAFRYCSYLESVNLQGVGKIGDNAFGRTTLKSINIPDAITEISNSAFSDCTYLENVVLSKSSQLVKIGNSAFNNCSALQSITIPSGVTSIGSRAFANCSSLSEMNYYANALTTYSSAFDGLSGNGLTVNISQDEGAIATIAIPEGLFANSNVARVNFKNIKNITLGTGVFSRCTKLTTVAFDGASKVTAIPENTFANCELLSQVILNNNLQNIGASAFLNCKSLMTFVVPENVQSIELNAFSGCTRLYEVQNLSGLTVDYCKERFVNAFNIYGKDGQSTLIQEDGYTFILDSEKSKYLLLAYNGNAQELELPVLTVNDKIEKYDIYRDAFSGKAITSVIIPEGVEVIGDHAFFNCENLVSVALPESLKTIEESAFAYTGLIKISIPKAVQEIKSQAFANCENLKLAELSAYAYDNENSVPRYAADIFNKCAEELIILFENKDAYQKDRALLVAFNDKLTYVLKLNLNYGGSVHEEEVLFGYVYGYSLNSETGIWENTAEENAMPVQKGYVSSVWYENDDFTGAVTAARLKELLSVDGKEEVTLYAKHIQPPEEDVVVSYDATKGGIALTVADLNNLFANQYNLAEGLTIQLQSFALVNGAEQALPEKLCDAGTYVFTVGVEPSYGELQSSTFKIVVEPAKIDITTGGTEDHPVYWGYFNNGFKPLLPGGGQETQLYIYNNIPFVEPQAGLGTVTPITVIDSYLEYSNTEYTVSLVESDLYPAATYSGNKGKNAGIYTASAVISLANNYQLVIMDAGRQEKLGLNIEKNDDGTVTIYKTWYIVSADSDKLLSNIENETPYSINTWTYNDVNAVFPEAPLLQFGNGHESEIITFTLSLNREEISKEPIKYSKWNDYFNISMPAGNYVITFYVDAFGGRAAMVKTFEFIVGRAVFEGLAADGNLLKGKSFTHMWDNEGHYYDEAEVVLQSLSAGIHPLRSGAWADEDYDKYYEGFKISYNLDRQHSSEYYYADDAANKFLPVNPDRYIVYFQLSAPSYEPLVNINNEHERKGYVFYVNIYRTLGADDFEMTDAKYTGFEIRPIVTTDRYLTVIWLDREGLNAASAEDREAVQSKYGESFSEEYVTVGSHRFVLKIEDRTYYQWGDDVKPFGNNGEYAEFEFHINAGANAVTMHLNLIRWNYDSYDPTQNIVYWETQFTPDEGYTFELILKRDTSRVYKLDVRKGINEFGNAVAGEYTLKATCPGVKDLYDTITEEITVNIQKASNYWKELPSISWVYGNFEEGYGNGPTAKPAYGSEDDVKYYYYKADSNHNAITTTRYDDIEDLLVNGEVPAGKYVLECELATEEFENFTSLKSQFKFTVLKADNYWDVTPNLPGWVYGSYKEDILPIAEPHFGQVDYFTYQAIDADGNPVNGIYYSLEDLQDDNLQIPVGTYRVTANVGVGDDYKEMAASTTFTVSRLANRWTETPNIVRWYYGEYDKGTNLISAVPAYGEAQFTIYTLDSDVYTALEFTDGEGNKVTSFGLDEDGFVPAYVANTLLTLDAKVYYLLASVEEGAGYTGINSEDDVNLDEATLEFHILKAQNYWVNVPNIIGWVEGKYNSDDNKLSVAAKYGDVIITITDSTGKIITTNAEGAALDLTKLKDLMIGNYELNAFVAVGDNFTGLDTTTTFAVFEDSVGVSGLIAAFMVFAVFALLLAVATVVLLIIRRRKIEAEFRKMIHTELNRR